MIPPSPLIEASALGDVLGIPALYLKFEGGHPTGTHKDRIASMHCQRAHDLGFSSLVAASCGNLGAALTHYGADYCSVRIWIPESFSSPRIDWMKDNGAEVIRKPFSYEACVEASRIWAKENNTYDANPGGLNTDIETACYRSIALEIEQALPEPPEAISVCCSNGTTLTGIGRFLTEHRRNTTLIVGSTIQNPIISSFSKNLIECETFPSDSLVETAINEPLINWCSLDGDQALRALINHSGFAAGFSDESLLQAAHQVYELTGLAAHPSGVAGLCALSDWVKNTSARSLRPKVAVITSRNY